VDEPLEDAKVDEDVRTLTHTLEDAGYVDAVVEAVVAEGGGPQRVHLRARPGPRTAVASLTMDSPEPLPPGERHELRMRTGAPYRVRDLVQDRGILLSAYRDAGYPRVEATPAVAFSEDRNEARVTWKIAPGPQVQIGRIVVAGLEQTREKVVRRELALKEGKPLGLGDLVESQKRLAALGIFERISITELYADPDRAQVLVVSAEEGPRTTFAYGVGYSERELLRGSVEVSRRNLGGLDRTLTAYARGSFRGSRLLLGYREPYLFSTTRDLYLAAFREEEARTGFSFTRSGVLAQTLTRLNPRLSLSVRYTFQDTHLFDVEIPLDEVERQFRTYTLSGPSVSVVSDRRDDALDPRRGLFLGADLQSSLRALGGASFLKAFVQASNYQPVSPRLTVALSGRVGLATTFGLGEPEQLPLPERFFAGGDYGPRGFKTDYAGPLDLGSAGEFVPTGGNALLFGGVELRYAWTRSFSFAAFSDVGTVYPLVSDMDLSELFYTTGVGLRYRTPVGPVRLEWGRKLNPRPGETPYRFHITIGNAF
jgi:outer membrane protein insertion porin family